MGRTPDDLGAILRGHLILERCLAHKCSQLFPRFEGVYADRLDMAHCLTLLRLVEAPEFLVAPCTRINRLRNDFAHGKQKALTLQHVQEIKSHMPEQFKGFLDPNKIRATNSVGDEVDVSDQAKPRALFGMAVSFLQMTILLMEAKYSVSLNFDKTERNVLWNLPDLKQMPS